MIEVKEITKEEATEEFNKLMGSTNEDLTVCVYDFEESLYVPIKTDEAVSVLGERLIYVYSYLYRTDVKFRPTKDGNVKMVFY